MLKIYLSGAISNKDIKQAKKEFADAEKTILKILKDHKFKKDEYEIKNPFKILKVNKKHKSEDYLREDIRALIDCDYLINIKNCGWKESKGGTVERIIAGTLGIKIRTLSQFVSYPFK